MGSDFVFDFRRNGFRFRLRFSPEWVSISSSILPERVPILSSIFAGMGSDFVSVKLGCSSDWFRFRLCFCSRFWFWKQNFAHVSTIEKHGCVDSYDL
jgi:hypothetical protein